MVDFRHPNTLRKLAPATALEHEDRVGGVGEGDRCAAGERRKKVSSVRKSYYLAIGTRYACDISNNISTRRFTRIAAKKKCELERDT